jgi:hypothetical protein
LAGWLFIAVGLFALRLLPAQTLGEVLNANGIPLDSISATALESKVSSGQAQVIGDIVAIAYPTASGDELIGPPLHVAVFNRATKKVVYRAIGVSESSDECFGSALKIEEVNGQFLVQTHINPSALCTLVLAGDLHVRHILYGWTEAQLGAQQVLIAEDEIHFAPVHPVRLGVFDLATGKWQEVYPPDGDPLRAAFSMELGQHLPPKSWCMEHDRPCDPTSFDEDVNYPVAVDPTGNAFSFVATYSAFAFGEDADREMGSRSVLYTYQRTEQGWSYCQEELADDEVDGRLKELKAGSSEAVRACGAPRPVKVKPVDSPFPQPQ